MDDNAFAALSASPRELFAVESFGGSPPLV